MEEPAVLCTIALVILRQRSPRQRSPRPRRGLPTKDLCNVPSPSTIPRIFDFELPNPPYAHAKPLTVIPTGVGAKRREVEEPAFLCTTALVILRRSPRHRRGLPTKDLCNLLAAVKRFHGSSTSSCRIFSMHTQSLSLSFRPKSERSDASGGTCCPLHNRPCHPEAAESSAPPRTPNEEPMQSASRRQRFHGSPSCQILPMSTHINFPVIPASS